MQQLEQDDSNCSVDAAGCGRYSTNKAGMNGLDRATILQIILENSKGSKFYENELRRERILQQQIERKLAQLKTFTSTMISMGETEADSVLKSIETKRCFSRCIMHLDMDAFYASVEIRDQPDLRFHPVAVGSNSMLSTSNYIARRFGVRPGLPGFLGKKLCPDLRIVPPDFARYTAASRVVRSVLRPYAAIGLAKDKTCGGPPGSDNEDDHPVAMVTASLDEAYLDLTQHLKDRVNLSQEQRSFWPRPAPSAPMLVCRCLNRTKIKSAAHGDSHTQTCTVQMQSRLSEHESSLNEENGTTISCTANMPSDMVDEDLAVCDNCGLLLRSGRRVFGTTAWEAAREIRFRIFCATRLTASAGLGPNTLTAKIASDWCKPSGQFEVARTSEAVTEFMRQLPVRKVPGIGHVTERRLEAFGIRTCRDLIEKRGILWNLSSRSAMGYYLRIAVGHSDDDWLPCSSPEILTRPNGSNVLALSEADSNQGRSEVDRKSMSVESINWYSTYSTTHLAFYSDTCKYFKFFSRTNLLQPCLAVLPPPVKFSRAAVHRIACAIVRKLQAAHALPWSMSLAADSVRSRHTSTRSQLGGANRIESWCAFDAGRFPRSERDSLNYNVPETDARSLSTQYFPKPVSLNVSMAFNVPDSSQRPLRSSDSNVTSTGFGRSIEQTPDDDRLVPSVLVEPSQQTSLLTSMISLDSQTNLLITRELRGLPLDNSTKDSIMAALRAELSRPKYRSDLFHAVGGYRLCTADCVTSPYAARNVDPTETAPASSPVIVTGNEFAQITREPRRKLQTVSNNGLSTNPQCVVAVRQSANCPPVDTEDKLGEVMSYLRDMLNVQFLSDVTFLILLLACSLNMLVLLVPFYYLPLLLSSNQDRCDGSRTCSPPGILSHPISRLDDDSAPSTIQASPVPSPQSVMLSIGLASVVGRMLAAVYIEKGVNTGRQLFKRCRSLNDPIVVNNVSLILCGLSLAYFPCAIRGIASLQYEPHKTELEAADVILLSERAGNFRLMLFHIAAVIYGITNGIFLSLRSLILVDLFGIGRLTNAFGYLLIFQGLAIICGPPLFGYFCDSACQRHLNNKAPTHSAADASMCANRLSVIFYLCAATFVLTSLLFLPLRWLARHDLCCPLVATRGVPANSQQITDQGYALESADLNPRTTCYNPQDTQTTHVFPGLDETRAVS